MAKLNREQIKEVIGSLTPDMLFNSQFSKYKSEPWSTPLEFFESDRFCGMHLYPNQRLMLKLWNLQIDDLTDYENQTLDRWCREFKNDKYKVGVLPDIRERIEVLKREGYKHFSTYVLVLGRRASKSFLSGSQLALSDAQMLWNGIPNVRFSSDLAEEQDSIVGGSDFWKQDAFEEAQDNAGIDKDTAVYSVFMATTMTQAQETIFKDYYNAVLSCKWLQDYVLRVTPFQVTYQTVNDRLKTLEYLENGVPLERELSSMVSRPVSSNSDSVRGRAVAKFCLASDTQVLMADRSHKAIIDLQIGDKLRAFDEHDHSKIQDAEVLAKAVQMKPAKRIWFMDGTYIDATDEHKFINADDEWVEVRDLHLSDALSAFENGEGVMQMKQIVKIEDLGEIEVVDITTSTHTFVANGLKTHNCFD